MKGTKTTRLSIVAIAIASLLMVGCSTMSKTGKGAAYGAGGGAALGAAIGGLAGGGKGAAIGAAVGAGVGSGTGALIGRRMDKKEAELAQKMKDAQVEQVEDKNGLQAIKVTFADGLLFDFNSTTLSSRAQNSLRDFASSLKTERDMDVTIYGHTDNRGSHEVNQRVSSQRAEAVRNFLLGQGVAPSQIINVMGLAFDSPIADNDTEGGRALNRRVEIFLTASPEMIKRAEAQTK